MCFVLGSSISHWHHQVQHEAVGFAEVFKSLFCSFSHTFKVTGNIFLLLQSPDLAQRPHAEEDPAGWS